MIDLRVAAPARRRDDPRPRSRGPTAPSSSTRAGARGSLAAEVSARITEQAFYELDAPVERVCGAEVPMPYAKHLEEAALPQAVDIVAAARRAVGAPWPDFRMPSLGADMEAGTLVEWLVKVGDPVHRGDVVAVVETPKSTVEVECFDDRHGRGADRRRGGEGARGNGAGTARRGAGRGASAAGCTGPTGRAGRARRASSVGTAPAVSRPAPPGPRARGGPHEDPRYRARWRVDPARRRAGGRARSDRRSSRCHCCRRAAPDLPSGPGVTARTSHRRGAGRRPRGGHRHWTRRRRPG